MAEKKGTRKSTVVALEPRHDLSYFIGRLERDECDFSMVQYFPRQRLLVATNNRTLAATPLDAGDRPVQPLDPWHLHAVLAGKESPLGEAELVCQADGKAALRLRHESREQVRTWERREVPFPDLRERLEELGLDRPVACARLAVEEMSLLLHYARRAGASRLELSIAAGAAGVSWVLRDVNGKLLAAGHMMELRPFGKDVPAGKELLSLLAGGSGSGKR